MRSCVLPLFFSLEIVNNEAAWCKLKLSSLFCVNILVLCAMFMWAQKTYCVQQQFVYYLLFHQSVANITHRYTQQ